MVLVNVTALCNGFPLKVLFFSNSPVNASILRDALLTAPQGGAASLPPGGIGFSYLYMWPPANILR